MGGVWVPIDPPPGMEYDFLNFDKGKVYGIYAQGVVFMQNAEKTDKDHPEAAYFKFGGYPDDARSKTGRIYVSGTTDAIEGAGYQTYRAKLSKIAANAPLQPERLGIYYAKGKAMLKLSGTMAKVFVNKEETARLDFDSISTTGKTTTIVSGTSKIEVQFLAESKILANYTDDKGTTTTFIRSGAFETIDPNYVPSGGSTSGSSDVNYGALIGLVVCVLIILGTK
jgi:hypothetical protein